MKTISMFQVSSKMAFQREIFGILFVFSYICCPAYGFVAEKTTEAHKFSKQSEGHSKFEDAANHATVVPRNVDALPRAKRQILSMSRTQACEVLCRPAKKELSTQACARLCGRLGVFTPSGRGLLDFLPTSIALDVAKALVNPKGNCGCMNDGTPPVCGFDNESWDNECLAACFGTVPKYKGRCSKERDNEFWQHKNCDCSDDDDNVCGTDGEVYWNECRADCKGIEIKSPNSDGSCKSCKWWPCSLIQHRNACQCPFTYSPVCGIDGQKYANECLLNCAGVPLAWPVSGKAHDECFSIFN